MDPFEKIKAACERPTSRVRFRFADGDWEEASGPEFLKRLAANKSGNVKIDWVTEKVHGENGSAL